MKRVLLLMGLAAAVACGSSAGDMLGEAFNDMTDVPNAGAYQYRPWPDAAGAE